MCGQVLGCKAGETDDIMLLRSLGSRLGKPGGMQEFLDVLLGDSGRAVSTFELLSSDSLAKLVAFLTGELLLPSCASGSDHACCKA